MTTASITYNNSFRKAANIKQDKKAVVYAILIVGILLISIVVVSAYTANLKYQNNELIAANEELQDDIDMLKIKIQTATNLENIEKAAKTKLGMTYPDSSQYIYISEKDVPKADFAASLKDKVYN